jgi:hypothetical protein
LHGLVLDPAGAVFVGIDVAVTSQEQSCRAKTGAHGEFNCALAPGRYNVVVSAGFLVPYRRAMVEVRPSSHVFLKLRPVLGSAPHVLSVPPVDPEELRRRFPDPQINYEEQEVAGADVIFQYASSVRRESQIRFSGPHLSLTADALSFYADELSCSDPIKICTGTGSVRVDAGEEQLEGTSVVIDLSARRFELSRDPVVTRTY